MIDYNLLNSELTDIEKDCIVGSLLGDGTICKNKKNNTHYLRLCQSIKQLDYLEYKHKLLSRIITKEEPYIYTHKDHGKILGTTALYTARQLYTFIEWHKDWYIEIEDTNKRYKTIPESYLEYLTPLGLAIWYMDDGSVKKSNPNYIKIATCGFNAEDLSKLQNYLKTKWDINARLESHKSGSYLRLIRQDSIKFINIIKDYVPESMQYKINGILYS